MRALWALMMLVMATPAVADVRNEALACVNVMETEEDWARCRALIFAPCATDEVGNAEHLACLKDEKAAWLAHIETSREALSAKLTSENLGALTDLYGQWIAYVGQKCPAIGLQNAETSREAAQLGCEITEAVGLSSEFNSCLQDNSTAPYCVHEEK